MVVLNIFGWEVQLWVFILICVGALLVMLLALGLLCCCFFQFCRRKERRFAEHVPPKGGRPPQAQPGAHVAVGYPQPPPGLAGAGVGVQAVGPTSAPPYPHNGAPPHTAVPIPDGTASLTPQGSDAWASAGKGQGASPEGAVGKYSPAAIKKWEEQLQATLFRRMSLEEVRASTGYFNSCNYIGEGAFAVVFKGTAPNGVPWAVKRSKQQLQEGSAGEQDFEKEVIAISRLSHKNLVRLLGYCVEQGEHILVYEYCPNGSLSNALYQSKPSLSFLERLDIALGTAEALYYLHSASSPPIIHRDVKPDNVFLDSQLQAKLGDFGLLKKLLEGSGNPDEGEGASEPGQRPKKMQSAYTRIAGTPGYLDPEYHLTSKVTAKGDVYSFGVLLLQLCTGQRAILSQHPKFNSTTEESPRLRPSPGASGVSIPEEAEGVSRAGAGTGASPAAGADESGRGYSGYTEPSLVSKGTQTSELPASGDARSAGVGSEPRPRISPEGEVYPGDPIHISTWLTPYVQNRVVEPVADLRLGNNYNKTALFRLLEIGLLCVQPVARKRPAMSAVTRWLHEVKEELEKEEVEEQEGQYSSVASFDREEPSLTDSWMRGVGAAQQQPLSAVSVPISALEMQQERRGPPTPVPLSAPVSAVSSAPGEASQAGLSPSPEPAGRGSRASGSILSDESSFSRDRSTIVESARLTEGR